MRRRSLLRIAHKLRRQRPGLPALPHALPLELARVAQWFHAFSDITRLGILELLAFGERCPSDLQRVLDVPPSRVSFHLKALTEAGLIGERREGRRRYYTLRRESLDYVIEFVHTVMPGKHVGICPLDSCA